MYSTSDPKTYKAKVYAGNPRRMIPVTVQAMSQMDARDLIEGQYGRENVAITPTLK